MKRRKSGNYDKVPFDVIRRTVSGGGSIHFVGIGGVSMYSLAALAISEGARVTGSDREESGRTEALSRLGAKVFIGHRRENIEGADLVVFSHAIDESNPELIASKEANIRLVNRAEYMGAVMLDYKRRIGVSGSHGKSTTVAMIDAIYSAAGADYTLLSGAELSFGEPFRLGSRSGLIYEACEFRDSFLRFSPTVAIALNLELDHTDYFPDIGSLRQSFNKALNRADLAIISGDDPNLRAIVPSLICRTLTFGRGRDNDYRYEVISFREGAFEFDLYKFDNIIGRFSLAIPGVFNLHNATAAIVTALEDGIDAEIIRSAIASFSGIPRRLERIGSVRGREVYYDYAHHPTEIAASLTAIKGLVYEPITLLFKPHTYSRTASLWNETCRALSLADYPVVCDIYPAREEPLPGVNSESLARDVDFGVYVPDGQAVEYILRNTKGAIVLMGAGDLSEIKTHLMR